MLSLLPVMATGEPSSCPYPNPRAFSHCVSCSSEEWSGRATFWSQALCLQEATTCLTPLQSSGLSSHPGRTACCPAYRPALWAPTTGAIGSDPAEAGWNRLQLHCQHLSGHGQHRHHGWYQRPHNTGVGRPVRKSAKPHPRAWGHLETHSSSVHISALGESQSKLLWEHVPFIFRSSHCHHPLLLQAHSSGTQKTKDSQHCWPWRGISALTVCSQTELMCTKVNPFDLPVSRELVFCFTPHRGTTRALLTGAAARNKGRKQPRKSLPSSGPLHSISSGTATCCVHKVKQIAHTNELFLKAHQWNVT